MKRKLKNEKYKYGNYDRYYSDRNLERWTDPRIEVFEKSWFENKKIADIGCNDGTLTILISLNFNPVLITGIEIDLKLVNRAVENVVYIEKCKDQFIQERERLEILEELSHFPKSFFTYLNLPISLKAVQEIIPLQKVIPLNSKFPSNICFLNLNYLENNKTEKFDTILCLSTVKWIHLNWGDEAVEKLFEKVYQDLENGGVFVFEPQPWKSYKKSRTRTDEILQNYHRIQFKPDQFNEYLIQIGFLLVKVITPMKQKDHFKRPVYVYVKGHIGKI